MKESVLVEEVDEALASQFEFVEDLQEEVEIEPVVETETETESISACNVGDTSGKIWLWCMNRRFFLCSLVE